MYILASKRNGTLCIGVTNDLLRRIYEHKNGKIKGFTKKYKIDKLVWYEEGGDINAAIYREKQLKKWNRKWKLRIIEEFNPNWEDLYLNLIFGSPIRVGDDREKLEAKNSKPKSKGFLWKLKIQNNSQVSILNSQ